MGTAKGVKPNRYDPEFKAGAVRLRGFRTKAYEMAKLYHKVSSFYSFWPSKKGVVLLFVGKTAPFDAIFNILLPANRRD